MQWQSSPDGSRLLGHMVLQKSIKDTTSLASSSASLAAASAATILGLKIVGGKQIYPGYYGALIEKVKKGSVADTVGHLLPGENHIQSG